MLPGWQRAGASRLGTADRQLSSFLHKVDPIALADTAPAIAPARMCRSPT